MHDFIQYGLLGIATGAIYAMLGNGMVVIYRGSGILNFAQGAFAMFGAYFYYELLQDLGWIPGWRGATSLHAPASPPVISRQSAPRQATI